MSRPGPVVFATRPQWTNELPPVVHTFMTSRGHSLISVRFRSVSPHLVAIVALDAVSDQEAAAGFLTALRDLAAGGLRLAAVIPPRSFQTRIVAQGYRHR